MARRISKAEAALNERLAREPEVPWEFNADGSHPRLVGRGGGLIVPVVTSLGVAKTTGVNLISGEFNGKFRIFRRWVHVHYVTRRYAHYAAIYLSCWQNSANPWRGFPSLCVRRAVWNDKKSAWYCHEKMRDPDVLRQHLLSADQLRVQNFFTDTKQHPELRELGKEIIAKAREGFRIENTKREMRAWPQFEFFVSDDHFEICVKYYPSSMKCEAIEDWVARFRRCVNKLDFSGGYVPDGPMRLSYESSIRDWLPSGVEWINKDECFL